MVFAFRRVEKLGKLREELCENARVSPEFESLGSRSRQSILRRL